MSDTNPKTIETIRANANTREQRVQRLAKIAGELLQIGEDTVSEYLARDAEIARLTAALRTETTMKEQLQDQLEERRLAYRAEWERAEGLTAELAGARRAATASIVSVNADRDRLTAELAEARAAVESFQRGSGCIDGYTIGEALAKIGASLDRTPTEGIPDAIARLKRAAETARREGARDERRGAIAELTILRNGSDPRADERIIAFDEAIDCLRQRASDDAAPVEDEDGAT